MLARMGNDYRFGGALSPLFQLHGEMTREMNRMFEHFFEDLPAARPYGAAWPAMNTWEDGDSAYVEAELPDLGMDEVEVLVSGNEVTVNGERKIEPGEGANWRRRERAQGRFSRTLALPWDIDADKVEAKLRDGVLTVPLPRCESCKPKKVKVVTA